MSKYNRLWEYIIANNQNKYELSFSEIEKILGFKIDHSFLSYKKELDEFNYEVKKISLKNKYLYIERKMRG